MVVVAAVLVVKPDEQGVGPALASHDRIDDRSREAFSGPDVLGVLLGTGLEVGVDDADCRQGPRRRVLEESLDVAQMADGPEQAQGVQVGRGLNVAADLPGHVW